MSTALPPTQDQQLQALRRIDALSDKLQKENKLLEALQCMEKSLILRGHIFGVESVEVHRACKSVAEMCNYLAMTYLLQDEFDITLELLKKAEVLTERHRMVRAVTLNNFACYYRKRGKLRTALSYVRKALAIESKLKDNVKASDTHLNICTILSELRRHEKAIVHARHALKLLLLELFGPMSAAAAGAAPSGTLPPLNNAPRPGGSLSDAETKEPLGPAGGGRSGKTKLPQDRVAVLAIAYHNLAVQQEFLKDFHEALVSYEKACKVVNTHLGAGNPLVKSLTDSYNNAKVKLAEKIDKQTQLLTKTRRKPAPGSRPQALPLSNEQLGILASHAGGGGNDGTGTGRDDAGDGGNGDGGGDGGNDGGGDGDDAPAPASAGNPEDSLEISQMSARDSARERKLPKSSSSAAPAASTSSAAPSPAQPASASATPSPAPPSPQPSSSTAAAAAVAPTSATVTTTPAATPSSNTDTPPAAAATHARRDSEAESI